MKTLLALFLVAASAGVAPAWEGRTHAGLTERAALASTLHERLIRRLGHPLGLYEPLKLALGPKDRVLSERLARLPPDGGYAPDQGEATALGWLLAGAVVEAVPAERARNHFYDPRSGDGLGERGFGLALRTRLSDVAQGIGTVRQVFTASSFDGSGAPATAWVLADRSRNPWGLERFLDERERAATAATPEERDDAMARALLAAGSILHVVEDLADPAHVRGDYQVALYADRAAFERWVDDTFARLAVPAPAKGAHAPSHLLDLLRGLASFTQQRFFSLGTLPPSGFPLPAVSAGPGETGYASANGIAHLAAWRRAGDRVEWTLDEPCFRDYAAALLPEAGRAAESALALLFRGRIALDASAHSLSAVLASPALGAGEIALYADDATHHRRRLASRKLDDASPGSHLLSADRPTWARHATAVFRGLDRAGEPVVIVQESDLE